MSAQLDAAAKEARKGNLDLKKQVRHIGNVVSNCVEVSAQEAIYLDLQIPLLKCTRDIVFVNTSVPDERIFLLKPKAALDELPAESTDVESDNVIQRYSKRPKQLSKFCLADYVSFFLKETKSQIKLMTKMMMTGVTVVLAMKVKTVLMMTTVEVQTCCTKQKWNKI